MLKTIKDYAINFQGYRTQRKLVVFLVDDYGTIRISSSEALNELDKIASQIGTNRFNKYDDIASKEDLEQLFGVLQSVKDKNGKPAVFTPMTVVANPDFYAIKEANFENYYFETFFQTLSKRNNGEDIKSLWEKGIEQGIFIPEFHGREHLNVRFWLNYLKRKDEYVLSAFNTQSIGIEPKNNDWGGYMAAFDLIEENHLDELKKIAIEGLNIFEKLFGYRSVFFTPPALIHNNNMHQILKENGIEYIDVARSRIEPNFMGNKKKRFHYMGQINNWEQKYITRNVMFEPNKEDNKDSVRRAMNDIEVAFRYHKPAIISSHRVNFVGGKDPKNRERGLNALKTLLKGIVNKWPDIEFVAVRDVF